MENTYIITEKDLKSISNTIHNRTCYDLKMIHGYINVRSRAIMSKVLAETLADVVRELLPNCKIFRGDPFGKLTVKLKEI